MKTRAGADRRGIKNAMIGELFFTLWILSWIAIIGNPTEASQWSGGLDESLDELHDPEIYRAVVESMKQWENQKKHSHRTKRATSRVCYEEVGCFEDTGPFSYLEMLPSHPKDVGTRFFMYGSRKARSVPMEVPADNINDKANNAIDPDLPTKVIVHGFGSGCEHVWVYEMRSALMSVHDCNIVCVDWSLGSAIPNYVRAAANTRLVGRQLAKLVKSLNVPLEKVHLIGFSLGAHVAGFAGAELGNVSRITGLDPAGPLFESQDPRARLDATDATFVDVIHSNGEQLILGGLGSWQPMGDVDFYPNGGRMQTGCSNIFLGAVSDIIWSGPVEGRSLCNHRRAYKLFTDSVSPKCRFPAFPCETGYDGLLKGDCFPCGVNGDERSCGDMGYYSDATGARGQLYLVTREEEPFCAHQYQLKVYNSRGERPVRSYGKLQVTLVGESNFNETFTMTRKDDEELLVGAILQKIVVPHPAIGTLEAIEIKYTAYSGWISSGLASWSIDKISVLDSFGKSLSVCMRGLTLESGRAIYLPLYPGECNIPVELENSTSSLANETKLAPMLMETMEKNDAVKTVGGIGPFTKEQNYDRNDAHRSDSVSINEKNHQQKGLGPFTKDQNINPSLQMESVQIAFVPKDGDDNLTTTETRKTNVSPWSYVDVSEAGSNSLENTEIETGRGFSGSNHIPSSTLKIPRKKTDSPINDNPREVREPVLQTTQKETGRSMRLPEITEPILRPRSTRQNSKNDDYSREKMTNDDLEESSTSTTTTTTFSRPFTVQFLPERLAGIFAQAERYARRTLLPLISQYTPSFIVNSQQERVKYFPSLIDRDENPQVDGITEVNDPTVGNTERNNEIDAGERRTLNVTSKSDLEPMNNSSRTGKELESNVEIVAKLVETTPDTIFNVKSSERSSNDDENSKESVQQIGESQQGDWIPIKREGSEKSVSIIGTTRNSSRMLKEDGEWTRESFDARNQSMKEVVAGPETKIDDWIPIVDRTRNSSDAFGAKKTDRQNSIEPETAMTFKLPWSVISTIPPQSHLTSKVNESVKVKSDIVKVESSDNVKVESVKSASKVVSTTPVTSREKKYIPLVDFEKRDGFFVPTTEIPEISTEIVAIASTLPSHIQKIPSASETRRDGTTSKRAMVFPYAYERQKDTRTRYIPLMPHEEMERINPMMEWDH